MPPEAEGKDFWLMLCLGLQSSRAIRVQRGLHWRFPADTYIDPKADQRHTAVRKLAAAQAGSAELGSNPPEPGRPLPVLAWSGYTATVRLGKAAL